VHGDVSGEEAAWRDLIARFDQPVDTVAAEPPWPARENLDDQAAGEQGSVPGAPGGQGPGAAGAAGAAADESGAAGSTGRPGGPAGGGPDGAGPGGATTPAGLAPGSPAPGSPAAAAGPEGTDRSPGGRGAGSAGAGTDTEATGRLAAGPEGWDIAEAPGGRRRIIRRATAVPRPAVPGAARDEPDDDQAYIPPPPEPLPQLDPVAKGAWLGLLGGPGYLLGATLGGWQVSDWAALVAIVAFIGGFATLVLRMGDKPRDDDDNGAVV
jgi:hypothetical protein